MFRRHLPLVALLCIQTGCLSAARKVEQALRRSTDSTIKEQEPAPDARIAVTPGHPRLFVAADWPAATDNVSHDWQAVLIKRADEVINKSPVQYSANKLLTRSRDALRRLSLLAGVYRFTHDKKYAEAGRRELLNVCSFPDWQPDDFLATGEMMMAVGTAYDWLYETLPAGDRRTVVNAIVRLGLKPALAIYDGGGAWTTARHNWNLVCNGGVIVAALAVGEEEPGVSRKALNEALHSIKNGLAAYDDNGGTAEGPMYHSYATRYLTFAAAALSTAAQHGGGMLTTAPYGKHVAREKDNGEGFVWNSWLGAGDYRINMTGPSGLVANFGDGAETLGNTAWMLWIGRSTFDERLTKFQAAMDQDDPSMFDLLWYAPPPYQVPQMRTPPSQTGLAARYGSAITLRSNDGQNFLALRTGGTGDHHSHLDLGNFVLDLQGQRFATDLGADNYDLPGYLGPRRAEYLRSSTPGHNTLSIGEASQPGDVESKSALTNDKSGHPVARVDLTDAYPGGKSIVRTATVDDTGAIIVDDIRLSRAARFVWNLHTAAKVMPHPGGATLELNGKRVEMKVVEPQNAVLAVEPDATEPPAAPVEGITHIRVRTPADDTTRIRVEFRCVR